MTEIKKNDVFTVCITALSSDGNGVGRHGGAVVFVPFTAVGDEVRVRAVKIAKSVIYAKTEEIVTQSPNRNADDCPVFTKCGGCDFRHISYEAEITAKDGFIRDAFTRIGGLTPKFLPIIGSDSIERYRNKAQFPLGKNVGGDAVYGFYAPRSHRIVPINDCKLHPLIFCEIADFIAEFARSNRISVYDETANSGVLRHICVRRACHGGEIHVTLVVRRKVPEFMRLARAVTEKFPDVKGVSLNLNREKTNVIFGGDTELLIGESRISDSMLGVKLEISPLSFYQVNTPAAEKLYEVIRGFAEPDGKSVLDLYCGIGAIGLGLAGQAREVIGVEAVESAVKDAEENARANGFGNARFIHANAAEAAKRLDTHPDIVILDPARKGCDFNALKTVAELSPERIIMVSCDAATAARDCARLSRLSKVGYKTVKVRGVDLFPRTRHVECAALLIRGEGN